MAGVTRAAVSNWRRRYPDFPEPASGTPTSPLFGLAEVQRWLDAQGKGQEISREVRLWQELRAAYGTNMVSALTSVVCCLRGRKTVLSPAAVELARELGDERTPAGLVRDLVLRLSASHGRAGAECVSTAVLTRIVTHFAGTTTGTVYDPACGVGNLLFSAGGDQVTHRVGQDVDGALVEFVSERAVLEAPSGDLRIAEGDSLRTDRFPELTAELVVCDPPSAELDWGRDELMLDSRWESGLPPKTESELAWLQHCYFHTSPGGRTLVVLPPAVAYRRSGRRIRAELVRKGIIETMIALPAGTVSWHALPVHLWMLQRPRTPEDAPDTVRMIDLTEIDLAEPIELGQAPSVAVPVIKLLDDEVDLTPSRYISPAPLDYVAAYREACAAFEAGFARLRHVLPDLAAAAGELNSTLPMGDLVHAGLVDVEDGDLASRTDQLDGDFLRGFARSVANVRRNTSASGTYRTDPRGARVPQMDIGRQREYGSAFRTLDSFLQDLDQVAKMGRQAAQLAHDGLTYGALAPPAITGGTGKSVEREGDA